MTAPPCPRRPPTCAGGCGGSGAGCELEILVTPEAEPRLQTLRVTPVGDPSPALVAAAERLLAAAADPAPAWPSDLVRSEALDPAAVERALRAGSARLGAMRLGLPVAGDGRVTTTWSLVPDRGRATLKLTLDAGTGAVTEAALQVARRTPPDDAW